MLPIGGDTPIRPGRFLPVIHWLYPLILFVMDLATWVVSYTVLALVFDKYQNYGASELFLPPLAIAFLLSLVGGYK